MGWWNLFDAFPGADLGTFGDPFGDQAGPGRRVVVPCKPN
jgi:hypothetical protein